MKENQEQLKLIIHLYQRIAIKWNRRGENYLQNPTHSKAGQADPPLTASFSLQFQFWVILLEDILQFWYLLPDISQLNIGS
jgi:hypothetical protein